MKIKYIFLFLIFPTLTSACGNGFGLILPSIIPSIIYDIIPGFYLLGLSLVASFVLAIWFLGSLMHSFYLYLVARKKQQPLDAIKKRFYSTVIIGIVWIIVTFFILLPLGSQGIFC